VIAAFIALSGIALTVQVIDRALPSAQVMAGKISQVSSDMMAAAARDPCNTDGEEARQFRSKYSARWAAITEALRQKYDSDLANNFGVVIPEGCRRQQRISFSQRRRTYEQHLIELEIELGISG
jgi:hypothetical protein